jgi:outer membrane protein assembly factor BamB
MRFPRSTSAFRRALAIPLLSALAACTGDNPFGARGGGPVGETLFGSENLVWFTPDSIGGWLMVPLLHGPRVLFERNLHIDEQGTRPGELVALDRATGAELWHSPMSTAENAAAAGDVIGTVWGALRMFDAATGRRVQTYLPDQVAALNSNVVSDGARFYVASHNGRALAVDPATGAPAWETDLAGSTRLVGYGVTLEGDALAVTLKHFASGLTGRDSGYVAVLDRATGAVRWRVRVQAGENAGIVEPAVIVNGLVVVVTQGSEVRAYDLRTGALRWEQDVSFARQRLEYPGDGLAACEGLVIVPTADLGIVALDPADGSLRWRLRDLGQQTVLGVQCAHGTVLTLGEGLRVFDARTGASRATYPIRRPRGDGREFMIVSAVNDAEFLYVGTTYGYAKVRLP